LAPRQGGEKCRGRHKYKEQRPFGGAGVPIGIDGKEALDPIRQQNGDKRQKGGDGRKDRLNPEQGLDAMFHEDLAFLSLLLTAIR
jgi:hypothetical protein